MPQKLRGVFPQLNECLSATCPACAPDTLPVHFHYLLGLLDLSLFSLLSLSSLSLFSLSSSCFFMEASFSCSICATKYQHLTQRQHTDLIKYACPTPANACFRTGAFGPDSRALLIPKFYRNPCSQPTHNSI